MIDRFDMDATHRFALNFIYDYVISQEKFDMLYVHIQCESLSAKS